MTGVTYNWDFSFLWMYRWLLLKGLGFTILYTIGSIVLGLILGLLVGLLRLSKSWLVNLPLIAYIEAFRCTPLLVQIIWFYYAFPVVIGVNIPAHIAAVTVLSLYGGAFYAEIVGGTRSAAVDSIQTQADVRPDVIHIMAAASMDPENRYLVPVT